MFLSLAIMLRVATPLSLLANSISAAELRVDTFLGHTGLGLTAFFLLRDTGLSKMLCAGLGCTLVRVSHNSFSIERSAWLTGVSKCQSNTATTQCNYIGAMR
jgi:hypothetical protein